MDAAEAALAANQAFYDAFNQKDAEAMAAIWADSPGVTCIHPGWDLLRGRDAVLDSWRNILTNPSQPRIVMGSADVTLHGALAIIVCHELVGGSPLVATNVFILQDEAWKLLHHHSGPVYVTG
jgi:ketosteroid isomerase-like protein